MAIDAESHGVARSRPRPVISSEFSHLRDVAKKQATEKKKKKKEKRRRRRRRRSSVEERCKRRISSFSRLRFRCSSPRCSSSLKAGKPLPPPPSAPHGGVDRRRISRLCKREARSPSGNTVSSGAAGTKNVEGKKLARGGSAETRRQQVRPLSRRPGGETG